MLLDTASLYFRAFYGVPDSVRSPDGTPVNAVRGLLDMVARLVTEYAPDELVACWDDNWRPHWRVALLPEYKAHRLAKVVPGGNDVEETPRLLDAQIPLIREVLGTLGIPVVGAEDHEADDVIGTLATRAAGPVDVVTGDRDLFQLVDDASGIRVIYTARGMSRMELVTDDVVRSKYGVGPGQYADLAAVRGDPSDGIPGVPGLGAKTAAVLLTEFGDIDGILAAARDPGTPLSASVRSRITAAAEYLEKACRVVRVNRGLGLEALDASIRPLDGGQTAALDALSKKWGLGGSLNRAIRALSADGQQLSSGE
jgi:5'-3' exonuclease